MQRKGYQNINEIEHVKSNVMRQTFRDQIDIN